jgi:peptide/nickel transport system permease protein
LKLWYFVVRRILLLIPFVIGLTLMTFLLSRVIPADPVGLAIGKHATEEMRQKVAAQFGLDKPVYIQYLRFLGDLVKGDFGNSLATRAPVVNDLRRFLPATLELSLTSLILAVLIGIPLGVMAARFRDRSIDHSARLVSLLGVSLPNFWLGLMLQLIAVALLPKLPISGRFSDVIDPPNTITGLYIIDSLLTLDFQSLGMALKYLFLPALTLSLGSVAEISRLTRSGVIEALGKDFVLTARASGLPEVTILFRHALRYASIPILTVGGLLFTWTLAGSVLVETLFAWPGLGRYAVKSSLFLDYRPLLAVVLVFGLTAAIVNLIVDILYRVLDPRVEYQ